VNSNQLGRVIGPTFMYNWLRPVSCGQAGPTRSRPTRIRAVGSAGSMSAGPRPPTWILYTEYSLHSCTHSSYYYIHVHIQVILHALHSFTRGPAHHCLHSFTPSTWGVNLKAPQVQFITRTSKLFSTPCTPLQFGGPGALHTTPCTVTPQALHQVLSVKALHSPSACSVEILHSPSTFCVKALHSQSTCGAKALLHMHYTIMIY